MLDVAQTFEVYELEVDALLAYQRQPAAWLDKRAPLRGMSDAERIDYLRVARRALEAQAALAMVSAVEAELRLDFRKRVRKGKKKDPLVKGFTALELDYGKKVPLDAILDVWKELVGGGAGVLGQFKQQYRYRHWLAHGRYWTNKSGLHSLEPEDVLDVYLRLLSCLRALKANYPQT